MGLSFWFLVWLVALCLNTGVEDMFIERKDDSCGQISEASGLQHECCQNGALGLQGTLLGRRVVPGVR